MYQVAIFTCVNAEHLKFKADQHLATYTTAR